MSSTSHTDVIVGQGAYCYRAVPAWPRLPDGWNFVEATAVATDARGNVFVFNRGKRPMIVFDRDGAVVNSWDVAGFVRPHGIMIGGPDGAVYCVDDQDHTVSKFRPDGQLLMTLGTSGQPSDTGAASIDFRTIKHAGPPFNYPTNLAIAPNSELFISDGYGNARIHRFSDAGKLLLSWGEPGAGPGQFHVPHGIAVDAAGVVYVADRENSRIQRFSPNGDYLDQWLDLARPCQVFIDGNNIVYVAELGYRAGMWPGTRPPTPDATGGRVSILNSSGKLLARWGGGKNPCAADDFFAPHDICVDDRGDIYVAEVTWSAGGKRGMVPPDCPSLKKFVHKESE